MLSFNNALPDFPSSARSPYLCNNEQLTCALNPFRPSVTFHVETSQIK